MNQSAASGLIKRNRHKHSQTDNITKVVQPPWWDTELENCKRLKYAALRDHRNRGTDVNIYRSLRNHFKKLFSTKRDNYFQEQRMLLVSARNDSKLFWGVLVKSHPM